MQRINRNLVVILSISLVIGVVLVGGCTPKQETQTQIIENVTPEEASILIQENRANADFIIIDFRSPSEFAELHIENAILIDFSRYSSTSLGTQLDTLNKDRIYLIYSSSGNRSRMSLAVMKGLKFLEIYHLPGGIIAWNAEGLPVVTE